MVRHKVQKGLLGAQHRVIRTTVMVVRTTQVFHKRWNLQSTSRTIDLVQTTQALFQVFLQLQGFKKVKSVFTHFSPSWVSTFKPTFVIEIVHFLKLIENISVLKNYVTQILFYVISKHLNPGKRKMKKIATDDLNLLFSQYKFFENLSNNNPINIILSRFDI